MKPLLVILCAVILNGCAIYTRLTTGCYEYIPVPDYWRVVSTDFEGRGIAEFIAEGPVWRTEHGFKFSAVQRRIYHPCTLEFHYPLGRPVSIGAPNIVVTPAEKPRWLRQIDRP